METKRRTHYTKERDRNAQLCGGADAIRTDVSRRRFSTHCPANRREGPESGGRRCLAVVASRCGLLSVQSSGTTRPLFGILSATSLARATILLVDDFDAASIRHRQSVRLSPTACGIGVRDEFARRDD